MNTSEKARARRRAEKASGVKPPKTLHCSFCGRSQHEVAMLVAGPGALFICDGCVGLCNDYMAGRTPDLSGFTPVTEWPTERLLALLAPVDAAVEGQRRHLQTVVDTLRAREVSWAQIAERLGVSRQAAWERFS